MLLMDLFIKERDPTRYQYCVGSKEKRRNRHYFNFQNKNLWDKNIFFLTDQTIRNNYLFKINFFRFFLLDFILFYFPPKC